MARQDRECACGAFVPQGLTDAQRLPKVGAVIGEFSACALVGLLALGGWERWQRDRARREIPIRIHVNGTRGKSTVTRLVAAALRASGRRTVAKTTGTAARVILPDGTERPVPRRARPSIREQLWLLREARMLHAQAVVVECMAIEPALQLVSERDMIASTIGVITNTRPDHADVMGSSPAEVAAALAHTVPRGAILVLGPVDHPALFEAAASRLGSRIVRATLADVEPAAPAWMAENLGIALAVTRMLGIPDQLALPSMTSAPEDPGTMRLHPCTVGGRAVAVVNASAANDPDSLRLLLDGVPAGKRLFVFNHRGDRPLRLRQFAGSPLWKEHDTSVLITGDTPDCATRKIVGLALESTRVGFAPLPLLARTLREQITGDASVTTVVLCGNARNLDASGLVAGIERV